MLWWCNPFKVYNSGFMIQMTNPFINTLFCFPQIVHSFHTSSTEVTQLFFILFIFFLAKLFLLWFKVRLKGEEFVVLLAVRSCCFFFSSQEVLTRDDQETTRRRRKRDRERGREKRRGKKRTTILPLPSSPPCGLPLTPRTRTRSGPQRHPWWAAASCWSRGRSSGRRARAPPRCGPPGPGAGPGAAGPASRRRCASTGCIAAGRTRRRWRRTAAPGPGSFPRLSTATSARHSAPRPGTVSERTSGGREGGGVGEGEMQRGGRIKNK